MKAHNLRILLITGLFFNLFQPLLAEENIRYYDIELVVFESREITSESNEIWPTAKQLEVPEKAAILGRKFEGNIDPKYNQNLLFNMLAVEDYQLTEEVDSIKASEEYRLLLHTGWRQPGLARKEAITVYFNHAIAENYGEPEAATETSETITEATTAIETTVAPLTPALGPQLTPDTEQSNEAIANLEGLITIVLSRYLHLDAEILYKKETRSGTVDMFDSSFLEDRRGKESVFYLKQNRRMRSKETHLIDHPRFSMLVHITPYELPTPPAAPVTPTTPVVPR